MEKVILWGCRVMVFIVFFFNVLCAVGFILFPQNYAPAYELTDALGEIVIRSMGILFLMWNVPYFLALIHPFRNFISLVEALLMQGIAVIGEILLWRTISDIHLLLKSNLERFIRFDLFGLFLLLIAFGLAYSRKTSKRAQASTSA